MFDLYVKRKEAERNKDNAFAFGFAFALFLKGDSWTVVLLTLAVQVISFAGLRWAMYRYVEPRIQRWVWDRQARRRAL